MFSILGTKRSERPQSSTSQRKLRKSASHRSSKSSESSSRRRSHRHTRDGSGIDSDTLDDEDDDRYENVETSSYVTPSRSHRSAARSVATDPGPSKHSSRQYAAEVSKSSRPASAERKSSRRIRSIQDEMTGSPVKSTSRVEGRSSESSKTSSRSRTIGESQPRISEENAPSSVINQFPNQTPQDFAVPSIRPAGDFGAAADFYGDQGQSVHRQPGVRPRTPIIVGTEPHLMAASAVAAPPQETGQGSAAEFYAGGDFTNPSSSSSTVKPSRPGPAPLASSQANLKPSASKPSSSYGSTAAMAAGAAALTAGAAFAHSHNHAHSSTHSSEYGSLSHDHQSHHSHHHHYHTNGDHNASKGPMGKLADWWNNYEDVARFEEWSEYTGICRYCFDSQTSLRDAPRSHLPRRRSSREFRERRRVDKETRYRKQDTSGSFAQSATLAGVGISAGAAALAVSRSRRDSEVDIGSLSRASGERRSGRQSPPTTTRLRRRSDDRLRHGMTGPSHEESTGAYRRVSYADDEARAADHRIKHPTDDKSGEDVRKRPSRSDQDISEGIGGPLDRPAIHARKQSIGSSESSSSDREAGFFVRLFSPSSSKRKGKHKSTHRSTDRRRRSSLSSTDEGLLYGQKLYRSSSRNFRDSKTPKKAFDPGTALLELGAVTTALAAASTVGTSRQSAMPSAQQLRQKLGAPPAKRVEALDSQRHHDSNEEEWESDAEGNDDSDASLGLAFGMESSDEDTSDLGTPVAALHHPHRETVVHETQSSGRESQQKLSGFRRTEQVAHSIPGSFPIEGYQPKGPLQQALRDIDPVPYQSEHDETRHDKSVAPPRIFDRTIVKSPPQELPLQQPQPISPSKPKVASVESLAREERGPKIRRRATFDVEEHHTHGIPYVSRHQSMSDIGTPYAAIGKTQGIVREEDEPEVKLSSKKAGRSGAVVSGALAGAAIAALSESKDSKRRAERVADTSDRSRLKRKDSETTDKPSQAETKAGETSQNFDDVRGPRKADSHESRLDYVKPNSHWDEPEPLSRDTEERETTPTKSLQKTPSAYRVADTGDPILLPEDFKSAKDAVDSVKEIDREPHFEERTARPRESSQPIHDDDIMDPNLFRRNRGISDPKIHQDSNGTSSAATNVSAENVTEVSVQNENTPLETIADDEPLPVSMRPLWARNVPKLEVIAPTPPASVSGSVGLRSPSASSVQSHPDRDIPELDEVDKPASATRTVSWGESNIYFYSVETPESHRDEFITSDDHVHDGEKKFKPIADENTSYHSVQASSFDNPLPSKRQEDTSTVDEPPYPEDDHSHEPEAESALVEHKHEVIRPQESKELDEDSGEVSNKLERSSNIDHIDENMAESFREEHSEAERAFQMPGSFSDGEDSTAREAFSSGSVSPRTQTEPFKPASAGLEKKHEASTSNGKYSSAKEATALDEWDLATSKKDRKKKKKAKGRSYAPLDGSHEYSTTSGPDDINQPNWEPASMVREPSPQRSYIQQDGESDRGEIKTMVTNSTASASEEKPSNSAKKSKKKEKRKSGSVFSVLERTSSPERSEAVAYSQPDPSHQDYVSTSAGSKKSRKKSKRRSVGDYDDDSAWSNGEKAGSISNKSTEDRDIGDSGEGMSPQTSFSKTFEHEASTKPAPPVERDVVPTITELSQPISGDQIADIIGPSTPTDHHEPADATKSPAQAERTEVIDVEQPSSPLSVKRDSQLLEDQREPRHAEDVRRNMFDLVSFQGIAGQDPEALPVLIPLPDSRPGSPYDDPSVNKSDREPSHTKSPSTTAVPLRFRGPPGSQRHIRNASGSSQNNIDSENSTPTKTRGSRPSSTEFRINEWRPLYLVERNRKSQEPEEILPSLPSSRTTSRSPSIQSGDDDEPGQDLEVLADSNSPKSLQIDVDRANNEHEYLDSEQTTPRALQTSPTQGLIVDSEVSRSLTNVDDVTATHDPAIYDIGEKRSRTSPALVAIAAWAGAASLVEYSKAARDANEKQEALKTTSPDEAFASLPVSECDQVFPRTLSPTLELESQTPLPEPIDEEVGLADDSSPESKQTFAEAANTPQGSEGPVDNLVIAKETAETFDRDMQSSEVLQTDKRNTPERRLTSKSPQENFDDDALWSLPSKKTKKKKGKGKLPDIPTKSIPKAQEERHESNESTLMDSSSSKVDEEEMSETFSKKKGKRKKGKISVFSYNDFMKDDAATPTTITDTANDSEEALSKRAVHSTTLQDHDEAPITEASKDMTKEVMQPEEQKQPTHSKGPIMEEHRASSSEADERDASSSLKDITDVDNTASSASIFGETRPSSKIPEAPRSRDDSIDLDSPSQMSETANTETEVDPIVPSRKDKKKKDKRQSWSWEALEEPSVSNGIPREVVLSRQIGKAEDINSMATIPTSPKSQDVNFKGEAVAKSLTPTLGEDAKPKDADLPAHRGRPTAANVHIPKDDSLEHEWSVPVKAKGKNSKKQKIKADSSMTDTNEQSLVSKDMKNKEPPLKPAGQQETDEFVEQAKVSDTVKRKSTLFNDSQTALNTPDAADQVEVLSSVASDTATRSWNPAMLPTLPESGELQAALKTSELPTEPEVTDPSSWHPAFFPSQSVYGIPTRLQLSKISDVDSDQLNIAFPTAKKEDAIDLQSGAEEAQFVRNTISASKEGLREDLSSPDRVIWDTARILSTSGTDNQIEREREQDQDQVNPTPQLNTGPTDVDEMHTEHERMQEAPGTDFEAVGDDNWSFESEKKQKVKRKQQEALARSLAGPESSSRHTEHFASESTKAQNDSEISPSSVHESHQGRDASDVAGVLGPDHSASQTVAELQVDEPVGKQMSTDAPSKLESVSAISAAAGLVAATALPRNAWTTTSKSKKKKKGKRMNELSKNEDKTAIGIGMEAEEDSPTTEKAKPAEPKQVASAESEQVASANLSTSGKVEDQSLATIEDVNIQQSSKDDMIPQQPQTSDPNDAHETWTTKDSSKRSKKDRRKAKTVFRETSSAQTLASDNAPATQVHRSSDTKPVEHQQMEAMISRVAASVVEPMPVPDPSLEQSTRETSKPSTENMPLLETSARTADLDLADVLEAGVGGDPDMSERYQRFLAEEQRQSAQAEVSAEFGPASYGYKSKDRSSRPNSPSDAWQTYSATPPRKSSLRSSPGDEFRIDKDLDDPTESDIETGPITRELSHEILPPEAQAPNDGYEDFIIKPKKAKRSKRSNQTPPTVVVDSEPSATPAADTHLHDSTILVQDSSVPVIAPLADENFDLRTRNSGFQDESNVPDSWEEVDEHLVARAVPEEESLNTGAISDHLPMAREQSFDVEAQQTFEGADTADHNSHYARAVNLQSDAEQPSERYEEYEDATKAIPGTEAALIGTVAAGAASGITQLTAASLRQKDDDPFTDDQTHFDTTSSISPTTIPSRKLRRKSASISPAASEIEQSRRNLAARTLSNESRPMDPPSRPKSGGSMRSTTNSPAGSQLSQRPATPSLRRVRGSISSDLRAASKRDVTLAPLQTGDAKSEENTSPRLRQYDPLKGPGIKGNGRDRGAIMSEGGTFEGWGDGSGSPMSPRSGSRPQSVRRKQSSQLLDLETRLEQVLAENRELQAASERHKGSAATQDIENMIHSRDMQLREKALEINTIRSSLQTLQDEITRLTQHNENLQTANRNLVEDTNGRYATLQAEHEHANEQWQSSARDLEDLRDKHHKVTSGMEDVIRAELSTALADKNEEIESLRSELEIATDKISMLQQQIIARQGSEDDDFLSIRDEDYFDSACQQLCQHVQHWVLRFSKFSDNKACRLSAQVRDEKIETRLDNTILDGSDVDNYLSDRVRRRDVFMSLVMNMIWEFIFTRYLFGMERDQRQKLKALERTLAEVGPARAIAQWRAITLTLLSRRESFREQRQQDTEAVVQEIFRTISRLLPPPSNNADQLQESLRNVVSLAIDLSIEMRIQRAEYIMLPPLQPEYDTNGELARKVYFNASLMNERSGETGSNEDLEAQQAVVRLVLFPLVVKKGNDAGESDEEVVICPAQVLVAKPHQKEKKVVRVLSAAMSIDQRSNLSARSPAASAMDLV